MIKAVDFIKALKHLALERVTYYDNSFPGNCGEINPDGSISFDCIGLVKSLINELDIAYKTSPAGYYVRPGQVIPDTTENGILSLCTDVRTSNFLAAAPGSYLCMYASHAGVFVGEFEDPSGICNVIECTAAFDGGVTTSYVSNDGTRYDHKGGAYAGKWNAYGKLSRYIEYPVIPSGKISQDGEWGKETTTAVQKVLKREYPQLEVDGIISGQDIELKKYLEAADASGWEFVRNASGSATIKALQNNLNRLGCSAGAEDGIAGPDTVKGLQRFLNKKGYAISVDGYMGRQTVYAYQTFINKIL